MTVECAYLVFTSLHQFYHILCTRGWHSFNNFTRLQVHIIPAIILLGCCYEC